MSEFHAAPNGAPLSQPVANGERKPAAKSAGPIKRSDCFHIGLAIEITHEAPGGYLRRSLVDPRIQAARLTVEQATSLKLLRVNLHAQHAQLANGRHVESDADVIRFLLEQLASPEHNASGANHGEEASREKTGQAA